MSRAHIWVPALAACVALAAGGPATADVPPEADRDSVAADSSLADGPLNQEPPADAPVGRDYEVERGEAIAPSEVEVGWSLVSSSRGRLSQRRRVRYREDGVEAELREGRGDALSGAALGARVPGGWLAIGRASPRWGRGVMLGTPAEAWRARSLAGPVPGTRPRDADAFEFRSAGAVAFDAIAARLRRDAFTAASLAAGPATLEIALTRALETRRSRALAGLRIVDPGGESEAALDARGAWRLEAARFAPGRPLALAARVGHFDFEGVQRARVAPPAALLGAALRLAPRSGLSQGLEGSLWRFPGGQTGHRGALEVRADMAQHESIAMGFEERRGARRFTSEPTATRTLRQGVWAEWRREGPGVAMRLRREWWGESGGLGGRVRELASAEFEARSRSQAAVGWTVWLYRTGTGDPQYVTESETDRNVWRALSGAGHRTRLRVQLPAAGGSIRAALTVTQSGGEARPAQWTLDWTRRAHTR